MRFWSYGTQRYGNISSTIEKKKKADIIKALYETLVVKHLLRSVLFWPPHLKKAAVDLENIQKRTTVTKGLKPLPRKE